MPIKKMLGVIVLLLSFKANANVHLCTKHDNTKNTLACAMYAEARNQGDHGMFSVGNVILNRTDDSSHPDSIRKVILQKDQFSYTSSLPFKASDKESFNKALNISEDLITMNRLAPDLRVVVDPTKGATFFKTRKIHPKWSKERSFKLTYTYKGHQFFKEDN